MAAASRRYLFHILYQGAYEPDEQEKTCTDFCKNVLEKVKNKSFFSPKRDALSQTVNQGELGQDMSTLFNEVLDSSDKSLVLSTSQSVEDLLYPTLLRKVVDAKDRTPVFSVTLGQAPPNALLDAAEITKVQVSSESENWIQDTEKLNNLFGEIFQDNEISISVPEITLPEEVGKSKAEIELENAHRENAEDVREMDALTRWMNTFQLDSEVKNEVKKMGVKTRDDVIDLLDDLENYKVNYGFSLAPVQMKKFKSAAQKLKDGEYIWRERMDRFVLKSKQWHLMTTVRLKIMKQGENIENYTIDNMSAFIQALSFETSHPGHNLFVQNQSPGSIIITFIAKCKNFDELEDLQKRLIEKASRFDEPFCTLKEENIILFPDEMNESDRPPIVSKMLDMSEEYDAVIFHQNADSQPSEVDEQSEKSQVQLSALPDEILVNIFQWLPFSTKISVLPEVCQKWKRIASDFYLFPTTFDFRDIPAQSINKSMNFIFDTIKTKENRRPTKLILPRVDKKDTDEYKIIVNLLETGSNLGVWKSLTKLSARKIDINEEVFSNFISSLNCEIFTELSIYCMTPHKMYSICRHLTKLQRFIMWDRVEAESLLHLVNAGSDMKYLRELCVNVQIDVPGNNVTNILKTCREQLELLTLVWYGVEIDSSFMKSLGLCRKLTYLHVILLREMEYDELRRTLSSMTQLEQLHLAALGLTRSRTSEDSLFQELNKLRHVNLHLNKLQDKDVTDLCINCGHCLETIHLNFCYELTDTAMTSIITSCNKLVALKLVYCKNIDEVKLLEKLTEKPENDLPQLVLLNLYYLWYDKNKIPGDVLSNCLTARPQLFIKTKNNSIDEISASSVVHKILGPNCHHRKSLIRELMSEL